MQPIINQEVTTLADRMFGWWYRIAAPPEVPDEAPLRDRMRIRSGRVTSVFFLIEMINTLLNLIVVIQNDPPAIPALSILFTMLLIGTILNRFGKTTAAGILVLFALEVGLTLTLIVTPGGFGPLDVELVDNYILGELITASLFAPWIVLPLTLVNCIVTVALIRFLPKTPEVLQAAQTHAFQTYANSMVLQITVAITLFLWVSSTFREMKRAGNAEEVSRLTMELAKQQQTVQEEKQRLEESVQKIVAVHVRVANGDFNARVPLDQQNVLWSVAGSLNNLLARLQRWRYDAVQLRRNERAIAQLLYNVQMARRYGVPLPPYKTGTSLDALITEISKGVTAPPQPSHDRRNNYI
jgi:hypothetical protein